MVILTQTIRRQKLMNCLSVSDHFVGLALKRLSKFYVTFKVISACAEVTERRHFILQNVSKKIWFPKKNFIKIPQNILNLLKKLFSNEGAPASFEVAQRQNSFTLIYIH